MERALAIDAARAQDTPRVVFVVSGGQGDDEVRSEADAMADYLRGRGVPADQIVREDRSVNTGQNLRFSAALVDGTTPGHRATVVTSGFHVYRTTLLARRVDVPRSWWTMPADSNYLWRYLPYHLAAAVQHEELAALVCDLRWVEAKTRRLGSVVGVVADLELSDTPTARILRGVLQHAAHLLGAIDPPEALGATLAAQLHDVPGLEAELHAYRQTLSRPRLEPTWPMPDRPDPARPYLSGHKGAVTSCAFSPDGSLLATTSNDHTARMWRVTDGAEQAVLSGHTGGVWDCAFSPGGTLLATASNDHTTRLWRVADSIELAVLIGHTDWVTSCAFSPDGALLATTSKPC
nr:ElyC/SanA/YdcF family protein [Streptomyces torulosus]